VAVSLRHHEITPGFGAVIEGLSFDVDFDPVTVRELRRAFDEFGVLVFRDVEVGADAQRYLCGLLVGPEAPTDRASAEANSHLYSTRISNKDDDGNAPYGRLLFHADGMWSEHPQELLSLYGERVDPPSVPTVFVSATRAWERLPDAVRTRIEGSSAVHSTGQRDRGGYGADELLRPERSVERSRSVPIEQVHPRTGKPILYVSQMMTSSVEGLGADDSESLLEELFAVLYAPEHSFAHEWRERDLVVWDNLAVQHARGRVVQEGPERSLRKVTAPAPNASVRAATEVPSFDRRNRAS
jgi:taurine dioxygenase